MKYRRRALGEPAKIFTEIFSIPENLAKRGDCVQASKELWRRASWRKETAGEKAYRIAEKRIRARCPKSAEDLAKRQLRAQQRDIDDELRPEDSGFETPDDDREYVQTLTSKFEPEDDRYLRTREDHHDPYDPQSSRQDELLRKGWLSTPRRKGASKDRARHWIRKLKTKYKKTNQQILDLLLFKDPSGRSADDVLPEQVTIDILDAWSGARRAGRQPAPSYERRKKGKATWTTVKATKRDRTMKNSKGGRPKKKPKV